MPINAYITIKLIFLDLQDEMPMTIHLLEDKIDPANSFTHDFFLRICDEIIAKFKKKLDENNLKPSLIACLC